MAQVYRGTGTSSANTGAGSPLTPGLPAGYQAGDLLIVAVETDQGNVISIANWTQASNSPINSSANLYVCTLHVYYRYATGDANDACSINISAANHGIAQMIAFYNTVQTGDPFDDVDQASTDSDASSQYSTPSLTTTGNAEYCVVFIAEGQDSSSGGSMTTNNANCSSVTQVFSIGTSTGNGGQVGCGFGIKDSAGVVGAFTGTIPYASPRSIAIWVGALKNPVSGPTNVKSYNTNLKANIKTINTNPIANVKSLDTNV